MPSLPFRFDSCLRLMAPKNVEVFNDSLIKTIQKSTFPFKAELNILLVFARRISGSNAKLHN